MKASISKLLGSKARAKMIHCLCKNEELNISAICEKAKVNHHTAKNHLKLMISWGVVKEKRFGRIKVYTLRKEIPEVKALIRIFLMWDTRYFENIKTNPQ